jgi:outer membrane protein OmpA-like peptidoglycan-associated protein
MRLSRVLQIASVSVVALPLLVGCGSQSDRAPGMTAFVAGMRSNMPVPKLVGDSLTWADDDVVNRDTVWVVGVSGRPEVTYQKQITTACDSPTACDGAKSSFRQLIDEKMTEVKPTAPEADTFGAIVEAAQQFQGFTGPRHIVVIDNGLQTTGDLELQAPGALGADPQAIVSQELKYPGVEALKGVQILLTGLGSYAGPQAELSLSREGKLTNLWKVLLEGLGATVKLDTGSLRGESAAALPAVSVVLGDDPPIKVDPRKCVTLREDQVGFIANQATLRDPTATAKVLQPVATGLETNGGVAATVIGTTALAEPPPYPLSLARAQTVIEQLIRLGVNRSLLTPQGVGINFGGYQNPVGPDGRFNETLAVQDRLVIIRPIGAAC